MSEQDQDVKDALLKLLEPNANGDVQISIAISLRKISDSLKLAETPAKAPPIVIRK
jgi:hypothetical protein